MMKLRLPILILALAILAFAPIVSIEAQTPAQAPIAPSATLPAATAPTAPSYTPPTPVPGPYTLGPDSQRQAGVPKGVVTKYTWSTSQSYPGTTRDYWIYVPAQYTPTKPACVMVFQDGGGMVTDTGEWRVPVVFDNLIAKGDMPVTIGVFINPGVLTALAPDTQQNRFDRSYEYDALGDRYARVLAEEMLPQVAQLYHISSDPNDRAIAGSSSGGIAAFNAAWNRPDQFHRVMSFIGSFTNLRGGDELATLIRKTEPKPLRVFLQDGSADNNIYAGNWFLANQEIFSALQYAGYESNFVPGTGAHSGAQGASILPDALRWLWHGYPAPVAVPAAVHDRGASDFIDQGKGWELVGQGYKFADGAAVDKLGNVYFMDGPNNHIYKIDLDGKVSLWKEDGEGAAGMVFGPDGRMYLCEPARHRIVTIAPDGTETVLAEDVDANDLTVLANNTVYFTDSGAHSVWFIDAKGEKRVVYAGTDTSGINYPSAVRTSIDQSLLMVSDARSKWVWSFQIEADGSLADGEPFYRLETPDDDSQSGSDGMTLDTLGFLYVTTKVGVQICDQPGRVEFIVSKPQDAWLASVVFGGPDMQWLYVTSGDKVYRRHMARTGIAPWATLKPPQPRL